MFVAGSAARLYAHEPVYGLGPETLPKNLNELEFETNLARSETGYSLAWGYGITENWSILIEEPLIGSQNELNEGNIGVKTKFRIFRISAPGVMKRLTAIASVKLPTATLSEENFTQAMLGIAKGYESRRWYYWADVAYSQMISSQTSVPGNHLDYDLAGGIRPVKSGYLKPDLVLLVQLSGQLTGKTKFSNKTLKQSGGNTLALAPSFLLSYRNLMLKGSVQFGLSHTAYAPGKETNAIIGMEYHF